jgi:hypothetical protein
MDSFDISPRRARDLVRVLSERDPNVLTQIKENRWYMGQREGHLVGWTKAAIDFIKYRLTDAQEGYVACFLQHVPEGQFEVPIDEGVLYCGVCVSKEQFNDDQGEIIIQEAITHKYYLGQRGEDVSEVGAQNDFVIHHGDFAEEYRRCFEERVCPARNQCRNKVMNLGNNYKAVKENALSA